MYSLSSLLAPTKLVLLSDYITFMFLHLKMNFSASKNEFVDSSAANLKWIALVVRHVNKTVMLFS